jgi:hypothetical protein
LEARLRVILFEIFQVGTHGGGHGFALSGDGQLVAQRPELAGVASMARVPRVVAGQVHVLPGGGPDVREELVGHVLVSVAQVLHRVPEVAGVPGDDGGDEQVDTGLTKW